MAPASDLPADSGTAWRKRVIDRVVYFPIWVVFEILGRLPLERSVRLGASLGRLYGRLGGARSGASRANIELVFPSWSDAEREALLLASFANMGRSIAETAQLRGSGRRALLQGVRVEGAEHYEAARARSKTGGVLAVSAHFGSWELLGAAMVDHGYPLSVVHHTLENPHLDHLIVTVRQSVGLETLAMGGAGLGVIRAVRRGQAVALLMDQNAGRDEGVFAPFFSHLASTRSAPARLAVARDIPVLPVFIFREPDGGHVTRIYPALELEPEPAEEPEATAALERNVARMNRAIEVAIEAAPDEWIWVHKRWKTRPEGAPKLYPRRVRGRA